MCTLHFYHVVIYSTDVLNIGRWTFRQWLVMVSELYRNLQYHSRAMAVSTLTSLNCVQCATMHASLLEQTSYCIEVGL
jgi:hypothetical protein